MSLGDISCLISDIALLESAHGQVKIKASLGFFFFTVMIMKYKDFQFIKIDHQKIEIEKLLIAIKFLPAIKYSVAGCLLIVLIKVITVKSISSN